MSRRGHVLPGRQCAHPRQRVEADRAHHDKLIGQRFEQQIGLGDDPRQFRLDAGGGDEFFESGQPRAVALAAEGDGVGLAGVESVHECVRAGPVGVPVGAVAQTG